MRVETKLVSVPAVITKRRATAVGLRREIVVFEDGQPQSIANFRATEALLRSRCCGYIWLHTRCLALIRQAQTPSSRSRPSDRVALPPSFGAEGNTSWPPWKCAFALTGES